MTCSSLLQELVPAPAPGPLELIVEGIVAVIAPEAGKAPHKLACRVLHDGASMLHWAALGHGIP